MEEVIKYGYAFFFIMVLFLLIVPFFEEPLLTHGPRNSSYVALTFNSQPAQYTHELLDVLKQHNVSATFFVTGDVVLLNNQTYVRIVERGHEIGVHGMRSDHRTWYEKQAARNTLSHTKKLLLTKTRFARPMHVFPSPVMKKAAQEEGFLMVGGDVVVLDGAPAHIAQRVLTHTKQGSIIIVEGGEVFTNNTLEALPLIIQGIRANGWEFVTLSTLFDQVSDG